MAKTSLASALPFLIAVLFGALLSGCASMPSSGANAAQVQKAMESMRLEGIVLVDVDDALTRKLSEGKKQKPFSAVFPAVAPHSSIIGPGDILEISVWETPPSMLFGGVAFSTKTAPMTSSAETLPIQMVMEDGEITMPFVGRLKVAGRSIREVESDIERKLQGQANRPQVMARIAQNSTALVTIIGDVASSMQMPLTPRGERLLDALAQAGGVTQPVTRMSVQISRADITAAMPMDAVIRDPAQNIALLPGDVVTALFQPLSFSVLGAAGKNQEVPLEAQGISLAQALARSGGLNDTRADPAGVFLFRYENASLVNNSASIPADGNGTVPVIYQINLNDPASFFVTQNFPIQNNDVLYVSNAPSAELEKFLRMIGLVLTPAINSTRLIQTVGD